MKNKFFSVVNIFGLSVGLACCMLIALYLNYETSYDGYQKNIHNLYEIGTSFIINGQKDDQLPYTSPPVAGAMKQEFPEVTQVTRLIGATADEDQLIQYTPSGGDKKSFVERGGYLADPSFFSLFDYDFTEGKPNDALSNPKSIVISEDIAKKIFGNEPALNKVLHVTSNINGEQDYKITGIFRPSERPSNINGRFFISLEGGDIAKYLQVNGNDFARNYMFYSFALLRPGADPEKLQAKFSAFIKKYEGNDLKRMGRETKHFLTPVADIHLSQTLTSNITAPASITYLYVLTSIAMFILLIACVNFMNLSTARSSKRSAEVGVRKVLGAEKKALVRQFLGESLLMTFIALFLAIGIVVAFLPAFKHLSDKNIGLSFSADESLFAGFLGMALLTGLIAGSYPAFYLSSFNPVTVLKGKLVNSLAVVSIRKGLVVFQFVISVILIIASVVIGRQMRYLRTADLGFSSDQQIVVPLRSSTAKSIGQPLRDEINNDGRFIAASMTTYYPGIANLMDAGFYKDGQNMSDSKHTRMNNVDDHFLATLGFKCVAGRLFSPEIKSDTDNHLIINEDAAREIGFASPEKAVGQNIYFDLQGKKYGFLVIGVVKDFHFEDLHDPVEPFCFQLLPDNDPFNYLVIHARAGHVAATLKILQQTWKKFDQNDPFEYTFLDEDFQKNYEADNRLAATVSYFTFTAILISCLGLFGLAAFSAEQRTKEIGVRKVLGANVSTIVALLSVDFLKLIIIAIVIASPIAWWAMNKWLQEFAYKQPIDWTIFAFTALIALLIGIFTIGSQSIRAAKINPVKSLRTS